MTVKDADLLVPPHETLTVCSSEGEASAGTRNVTVELSAPTVEVGSGSPSHCHTIVCEMLDPPRRHAPKPVVVAVTKVCPGVPCSGERDRLGFSVPGAFVTVNVAESAAVPGPTHDAVTSYVSGVASSTFLSACSLRPTNAR